MSAASTQHIANAAGTAWSEDPAGRELSQIRLDLAVPEAVTLHLPRRGPLTLTDFGDTAALEAVRAALLEAETALGGPVSLQWRADAAGEIQTEPPQLMNDPLPWGGAPGQGLRQAPAELDRWSRANAGEVIPNVLTPLSWSVISDSLDRGFHAPWGSWTDGRRFVAMFDGYVYFNVGLMMELIQVRLGLTGAHFLEAVGGPEAAATVKAGGSGERATKIRWRTMLRQTPFLMRWLRDQDQLPKRWPQERADAEAERDRLKALDDAALALLSDRAIFRELTRSAAMSERQTIFLMVAQAAVYSAVQGILWATDRWLGPNMRQLSLAVMQGLPGVRTQEGNIALRRIAQRAAQNDAAAAFVQRETAESLWPSLHAPDLPAALHPLRADLDDFMAEYGHRAAGELEAAEPRWVEQPALILDTFREYVLNPAGNDPDAIITRQQTAREEAETEIRQRLRGGRFAVAGRFRWLLFRAQVQQARRLQPLRENPKFTLLELSLQQRRLWRELGQRWQARGIIADPDDMYYLLYDELAQLTRRAEDAALANRLRSRIRRRRQQYQQWTQKSAPPLRDRYGTPLSPQAEEPAAPTPEPSPAPAATFPLTLQGIAASTGAAEGLAHVADSPATGRQLTPGQILVARFTDPGWTPIFPLAAAVVTEIGGVLSHGAIVAREFGIPAVVNVQKVTQQIRSGDLLRVDGSTGRVTILERRG